MSRRCPEWCEGGHRPDYPVHGREVGGIEIGGVALDVALFQNGDAPATVVLYVHDEEETRAIHMAPLDADALRAHLRIATEHLDGQR